jgi:hypothetical protein
MIFADAACATFSERSLQSPGGGPTLQVARRLGRVNAAGGRPRVPHNPPVAARRASFFAPVPRFRTHYQKTAKLR